MSDANIPCPAHAFAEKFIKEDQQVIKSETQLSFLDIFTYGDGKTHFFYASKKPFYDEDNQLKGIIAEAKDIQPDIISAFDESILRLGKNVKAGYSWVIADSYEHYTFTKIQKLILYYLLRGFSPKSISERLFRSKRTIEEHIGNIKDIMDCTTRDQLIQKSYDSNFANIIPKDVFESLMT